MLAQSMQFKMHRHSRTSMHQHTHPLFCFFSKEKCIFMPKNLSTPFRDCM